MGDNLRILLYMARHDPMVVIGFLLIGTFSILFAHIQFKMRSVGYKTYPLVSRPSDWGLPAEYLKIRSRNGWSPWPVYLLWPSIVLGLVSLAVGLFRLGN
ncbi:MAG TPA: hypothetical protein VMB47_11395 [Candidatus Aquilonibacter sp.]|nr:hypothetical protein [Candidatus Aquilonibacter sp.]